MQEVFILPKFLARKYVSAYIDPESPPKGEQGRVSMAYGLALLLLAVFTANVVMGAVTDSAMFGIVTEAIVLFAAAISFSVAILRSESRAKDAANNDEA